MKLRVSHIQTKQSYGLKPRRFCEFTRKNQHKGELETTVAIWFRLSSSIEAFEGAKENDSYLKVSKMKIQKFYLKPISCCQFLQ